MNLCTENPQEIGYLMLFTEGLNKEKIGEFFKHNLERN